MPGPPLTSPYAPGPERVGQALRIADLIRQQGYTAAETKGYKGAVVGDLVANTGGLILGALDRRDEQRKRQELADLLFSGQPFDPREVVAKYGVQTAKEAYALYTAMKPKPTPLEQRNPEYDLYDPITREIVSKGVPKASTSGSGAMQWAKGPDGVVRLYTNDEIHNLQLSQPDTADMRNKAAGKGAAGMAVDAVRDLGNRIFSNTGFTNRLKAAGRDIDAFFGDDPEFRTYQDARMALAGTLAVEQQGSRVSDADVKALWLPMVPDVYRDTKESNRMKWQLMDKMRGLDTGPLDLTVQTPPPDPTLPALPPPPPRTIGQPFTVPTPTLPPEPPAPPVEPSAPPPTVGALMAPPPAGVPPILQGGRRPVTPPPPAWVPASAPAARVAPAAAAPPRGMVRLTNPRTGAPLDVPAAEVAEALKAGAVYPNGSAPPAPAVAPSRPAPPVDTSAPATDPDDSPDPYENAVLMHFKDGRFLLVAPADEAEAVTGGARRATGDEIVKVERLGASGVYAGKFNGRKR